MPIMTERFINWLIRKIKGKQPVEEKQSDKERLAKLRSNQLATRWESTIGKPLSAGKINPGVLSQEGGADFNFGAKTNIHPPLPKSKGGSTG